MATTYVPKKTPAQQQADPTQLQTIGTAATAAPATTSQAAPKPQQPQGSGRFTNIQKYIGANQQGGKKLAGNIGSNIQSGLTKEQEATKKYNEQLGDSVKAAQGVAGQAGNFQNQLKGIGTDIGSNKVQSFDQWKASQPATTSQPVNQQQNIDSGSVQQAPAPVVQTPEQQYAAYQQSMLAARPDQSIGSIDQFTQSPDFNQFQNIQAGRGIDENLLANQQQRLAGQANQAATMANTAQQQLGNESGRFDLLRKTFGGAARPGYGQGQQRLDNALLGQGGGLGQVQSDVAAKNRELQAQAKAANSQQNEVGRLTQQEKDLISGINTQAGANESNYLDMLNSYVDPLNQQRSTEVQNLGKSLGSYNQPYNPANPGLNADQMAKLGLTDKNQGVYNVFKNQQYADPTGATDELKNRNMAGFAANLGRDARSDGKGYLDTANQADVGRYSALSKMMGANASTPKLTKASDLESAYSQKGTGEMGLNEQLASAQKDFDRNSDLTVHNKYKDVTGYGNANDLINSGKKNTLVKYDYSGQELKPGAMDINKRTNIYNQVQKDVNPKMYSALQKYLQKQNYNQTLGGRRETWLDSDPKYSVGNPKLDNVPITGYDPSKAGTK